MASKKVSVNDIIFTSIKAGLLAGGICLILLLPLAGIIKADLIDENNSPLLIACCSLLAGFVSGVIWRIGKRGRAATVLLSTAAVMLLLMVLAAGIRQAGQLRLFGIMPFSAAFSAGFGLSCIMQNNKKDMRRK